MVGWLAGSFGSGDSGVAAAPCRRSLGRRPPFAVAHLFAQSYLQMDVFWLVATARTEVLADGRAPYRQKKNCRYGGLGWDRDYGWVDGWVEADGGGFLSGLIRVIRG